MSDPDAEAVVRRWVAAWNRGDVEAAVALLSPAYVRHDANLPEVVGPEAEKQFMHGVLAAFAGLEIAAQAILADGDLVAARLVVSGRHVGEFLGIAATGQQVRFQSHEFFRVEGGKLAEQWVIMDVAGLLQQLGAVPKS
jgi:steroid delta-isomerase-like uncharacterized protein